MTSYRALIAELAGCLDDALTFTVQGDTERSMRQLIARARTLAQPEPEGPTDEELDELWAEIDGGGAIWAWQHYARAVLARWGRPTIKPVPVTERLPGPEDCDAEGRCWVGSAAFTDDSDYGPLEYNNGWELCRCTIGDYCWLPHHALPIPQFH
jgi:hypothetical protein